MTYIHFKSSIRKYSDLRSLKVHRECHSNRENSTIDETFCSAGWHSYHPMVFKTGFSHNSKTCSQQYTWRIQFHSHVFSHRVVHIFNVFDSAINFTCSTVLMFLICWKLVNICVGKTNQAYRKNNFLIEHGVSLWIPIDFEWNCTVYSVHTAPDGSAILKFWFRRWSSERKLRQSEQALTKPFLGWSTLPLSWPSYHSKVQICRTTRHCVFKQLFCIMLAYKFSHFTLWRW